MAGWIEIRVVAIILLNHHRFDRPTNAELWIVPAHAAGKRGIVSRAHEARYLACILARDEAVGTARWNIKRAVECSGRRICRHSLDTLDKPTMLAQTG